MARFKLELPTEIIKQIDSVEKNADKIFGEMTKAGAEVAAQNMRSGAPDVLKPFVKLTKTYKTPSDDGINTKAMVKGYIPFSDPNRKEFRRKNGSGETTGTNLGVPAEFLANLYEHGRSTYPFPKKPFVRKAFNKAQIEEAMLEAQVKASGGILDDK